MYVSKMFYCILLLTFLNIVSYACYTYKDGMIYENVWITYLKILWAFLTKISNYKFLGQKDPCLALNCQFGANCVLNPDRKTAYCACPTRCYTYGDSSGSRPVCGEDGRDYSSLCHIRK